MCLSFVGRECTHMTLSYSVELHRTPAAAAGLLPRNTMDADCSEGFWGETMEPF